MKNYKILCDTFELFFNYMKKIKNPVKCKLDHNFHKNNVGESHQLYRCKPCKLNYSPIKMIREIVIPWTYYRRMYETNYCPNYEELLADIDNHNNSKQIVKKDDIKINNKEVHDLLKKQGEILANIQNQINQNKTNVIYDEEYDLQKIQSTSKESLIKVNKNKEITNDNTSFKRNKTVYVSESEDEYIIKKKKLDIEEEKRKKQEMEEEKRQYDADMKEPFGETSESTNEHERNMREELGSISPLSSIQSMDAALPSTEATFIINEEEIPRFRPLVYNYKFTANKEINKDVFTKVWLKGIKFKDTISFMNFVNSKMKSQSVIKTAFLIGNDIVEVHIRKTDKTNFILDMMDVDEVDFVTSNINSLCRMLSQSIEVFTIHCKQQYRNAYSHGESSSRYFLNYLFN